MNITKKINKIGRNAIIFAFVLCISLFIKSDKVKSLTSLGSNYTGDLAVSTIKSTIELADSNECMHLSITGYLCPDNHGTFMGMDCHGHYVAKMNLDGHMAFCIDVEKDAQGSACYSTKSGDTTSGPQSQAYFYAAKQGTDVAYFIAQMYLWNDSVAFNSNLEIYCKETQPDENVTKCVNKIKDDIRNSGSQPLPIAYSTNGESQRFVSDNITTCQLATDKDHCCAEDDPTTYWNNDFKKCCKSDGSDCKCDPPSGVTQCGLSAYDDPTEITCISGNNTYADNSNFSTDLYKKYCSVFCKENVRINTPNNNPTYKAGRYFVIGSLNFTNTDSSYNPLFGYITASGSRTCYVYTDSSGETSGINISQFISDYRSIYDQIPAVYGEYLTAKSKKAALVTASNSPVTDRASLLNYKGCYSSTTTSSLNVAYQTGKQIGDDCLYGVPSSESGDSCKLWYADTKKDQVCHTSNTYGCSSSEFDSPCVNGKTHIWEWCVRRTYDSNGNHSDNRFYCESANCYGCYGGTVLDGQTCEQEESTKSTSYSTDGYSYYNSAPYTVYNGVGGGYTNWTSQYGCINGSSNNDAIASADAEINSAWTKYNDLVAQLTALRTTLTECSGRDSNGNPKISYNFDPQITATFDDEANSPYSYSSTLVSTTTSDNTYIYLGDRYGFSGDVSSAFCQNADCNLRYYVCNESSGKCDSHTTIVPNVNVKSITIVRDITKSYSSSNTGYRYTGKDNGYTADINSSSNSVDIGGNVIPLSYQLPLYSEFSVQFSISNIGHNGHFSSYNLGGEFPCKFNVTNSGNGSECADTCKTKYKLDSKEFYNCVVNETNCCQMESEYTTLCPACTGDNCGSNLIGNTVIYRTIQLEKDKNNDADSDLTDQEVAFPSYNANGRTPGDNWNRTDTYDGNPNRYISSGDVTAYINYNRNVHGYEVYNQTPLYTIELTPVKITQIRKYNKQEISNNNGGYADFNASMQCNSDGRNCISSFIHSTYRAYFDASNSKCLDINDSTFDSCRY